MSTEHDNVFESAPDDTAYDSHQVSEVAIIGMAGRFPGAKNVDELWENLRKGVESVSFFSDEELLAEGIAPEDIGASRYVKAKGVLDGIELFDAAFFDYNPREAQMLDPQLRIMLECAVEALENAGYDPEKFAGRVGVFAGVSAGSYLTHNLAGHEDLIEKVGEYQVDIGNHGDFVPTSLSFKLNLKGPSINVQTACSTSLVAVHIACQSLLNGECDMAIAGGASISFPHKRGYLYQDGGILSPDGHCRAFDAQAQGTIEGEGVGLVVLRRLTDALESRDTIHAIIKGSAVNNDGSLKVGFTAPSVDGQAEVVAEALALAGVEPETVTYIEAHGTGTSLGDPIEVTALTQAFGDTPKRGFCAIGSLKTNIGHLDAAAGIAGLIKVVQSLKHKHLPPSLHYKQPNPKIDFANSPFYVNSKLVEWQTGVAARRAGVSSFGIGGTNAHVVLEEAPVIANPADHARPAELLVISAKTSTALDAATQQLGEFLKNNPDLDLADVAYTLQLGRKEYAHRRTLVCHDTRDAAATLTHAVSQRVLTGYQEPRHHPAVFMFPGQGSQYVGMGRELYQTEPYFREQIDLCAGMLEAHIGFDLREILYPSAAQEDETAKRLNQTSLTQPALFVIEYALARLWMKWGVRPAAMIGHSIGEYVAACLAGVMSLDDALRLVTTRGRLMQGLPEGSMLAVPLSEQDISAHLFDGLSIAAINAQNSCVISGATEAVLDLKGRLETHGIEPHLLHTSHAFHSAMMEPILEEFAEHVSGIKLSPPKIPFISNVTGNWITNAEATAPRYWARHLRQSVRFAKGLSELLREPERILLEIGPGHTLSTLAKQHPQRDINQSVLNTLRHPHEQHSDMTFLLTALGRFWLAGGNVDWPQLYTHEQRQRIPLPTYPFERQRYFIEPLRKASVEEHDSTKLVKRRDLSRWCYLPSWKRVSLAATRSAGGVQEQQRSWLMFLDERGIGAALAERLTQAGDVVCTVRAGSAYAKTGDATYVINPRSKDDYQVMLDDLIAHGGTPQRVVHLWSLDDETGAASVGDKFERAQERGLYSLIFFMQVLAGGSHAVQLHLEVITDGVQELDGEETLRPERATILGACKVIPQEYWGASCRSIDVVAAEFESEHRARLVKQLYDELSSVVPGATVAYRGRYRWVQSFEEMSLPPVTGSETRLRENGVYMITGGLGSVGLMLAEFLAQTYKAKLSLISRHGLPVREDWKQWVSSHMPDDEVSQKIRSIQRIEEYGAQVLIIPADVADEAQMREAVALTRDHFGALHGVIHGAGARSEEVDKELNLTTTQICREQFKPKAQGIMVLERVLRDEQIDFCLMLSSLSTVLGGLTFTSYAAANIFMNLFTHEHNRTHTPNWICVNWDGFNITDDRNEAHRSPDNLTMGMAESCEVLKRVLALDDVPEIIVSTADLNLRLRHWVTIEPAAEEEATVKVDALTLHDRPNLPNPYVAPSNELEEEIVGIWQELLGISRIGSHDSFFDLGGHSLLATMVLSRLRKDFGIELQLRDLFSNPTVSGISQLVALKVIGQQDEQNIAALLEELDGVSKDGLGTANSP